MPTAEFTAVFQEIVVSRMDSRLRGNDTEEIKILKIAT